MTGRPTRRDVKRELEADGGDADLPVLSVVEGLSYQLQWADQEDRVIRLETGELRRFNPVALGRLAPVVKASVDAE
jgi:hypothetical protein